MNGTVLIRKKTGGCTITGPDGTGYEWKEDGDAIPVEYGFALALLKVPGGGFAVADEPGPEGKDESGGEAEKREPAPLKSKNASPTTPRRQGGTVKRS